MQWTRSRETTFAENPVVRVKTATRFWRQNELTWHPHIGKLVLEVVVVVGSEGPYLSARGLFLRKFSLLNGEKNLSICVIVRKMIFCSTLLIMAPVFFFFFFLFTLVHSLFNWSQGVNCNLQCRLTFPLVWCIQYQDLYISGTFRWTSSDGILIHLARSSFITVVCSPIHICICLYVSKIIGSSSFLLSNVGLSSHHLLGILIL